MNIDNTINSDTSDTLCQIYETLRKTENGLDKTGTTASRCTVLPSRCGAVFHSKRLRSAKVRHQLPAPVNLLPIFCWCAPISETWAIVCTIQSKHHLLQIGFDVSIVIHVHVHHFLSDTFIYSLVNHRGLRWWNAPKLEFRWALSYRCERETSSMVNSQLNRPNWEHGYLVDLVRNCKNWTIENIKSSIALSMVFGVSDC